MTGRTDREIESIRCYSIAQKGHRCRGHIDFTDFEKINAALTEKVAELEKTASLRGLNLCDNCWSWKDSNNVCGRCAIAAIRDAVEKLKKSCLEHGDFYGEAVCLKVLALPGLEVVRHESKDGD